MVGLIRSGNRFKSCPLKESDSNDSMLKELKIYAKKRHGVRSQKESKNKALKNNLNQDTSKVNSDLGFKGDEDDVFTLQELAKKRKIAPSSGSETIRRTNDHKQLITDEKQNIHLEIDDKYAELKPLESFVSSSFKGVVSQRRNALFESVQKESSENLTPLVKQNTQLFKDESASDISKKVKTEIESRYDIPPIVDSTKLLRQCEPVLKIVKYILKGYIPSAYYNNAKMLSQQSNKPFFSLHDIPMSSLNKFLAGFYGWKRQTIVGERFFHKYEKELIQSKSPVVKWWGAKDFAIYVLAPEVLTLVAILKMKIGSQDFRHRLKYHLKDLNSDDIETLLSCGSEMLDIFEATGEYGTLVTDNEPLESWEIGLSST